MTAAYGVLVLALFMAAAAVCDLRERRIPNVLTVGCMAVGLAFASASGVTALLASLAAVALALLVGLPGFASRRLGGGDVKLLAGAAAHLGPVGLLLALPLAGVAGGLLALAAAQRRGMLLPVLYDCRNMVAGWVGAPSPGQTRDLDAPGAIAVPYGVAIASAAVAARLLL